LAFTRFDFEVAQQEAEDGYCAMYLDTGQLLIRWETEAGWVDSFNHPLAIEDGWLPVEIPAQNVYVRVFCTRDGIPVRMRILNGVLHPQTGEIVGWLTRGVQNAQEIGWP